MPDALPQTTGRLAPSPTGGLHLGHARTFLVAWLASRSRGGRVILRVEDLDRARARAEAVDSARVDLDWLGLDWDEGPDVGGPRGPYLQSARSDHYQSALSRLIDRDLVYPCTCTRADIARAAGAPHLEDEGPSYPGTCAGRSASDAARLDRPFAWRFRVGSRRVSWVDGFLGPVEFPPERLGGDFVVDRPGVATAYQLAVVVDDAAMGVNQVIRGDDLVSSTPRQILLYEALGSEPPSFGHIPLVHGLDGRRLAKRDGSIKLATLRESGIDSRRLVGWLAMSCGWTTTLEPSEPRDWLGRFALETIHREPWVADLAAISG
jgi:glutamyl-tRNA synthetase